MGKLIDLTGQRIGRWVVLGEATDKIDHRETWLCSCDCGTVRNVLAKSLKSGRSKSCGCIAKEKATHRMTQKHLSEGADGRAKTRLYSIWIDMKRRCYDSRVLNYEKYGGRGITICKEWNESFDVFRAWALSHGYASGLSIDRIDNNTGYSPENCRWTTAKVQNNNRRNNHRIVFNGADHTLSEWEELTGISRATIQKRLTKYGWSVEKTLTTPPEH